MYQAQIAIVCFALGAFIVIMIITGIEWLLDRRKKHKRISTTPKVMILGVKDGEHQKDTNT